MNDRVARFCATFFHIGDFPVAPGSAASAAALVVAYWVHPWAWAYIAVGILFTVIGFMTAGQVEKLSGRKDPGFIVIDEAAGIMISFLFIPMTIPVMITGFFLFRAFDMFKIYPANKFEDMGGAYGIMMDDVMAGIYTNIVLQIAVRVVGIA
ncbi:MAG: phosphatidylglycerophosphatase A [Candidatus Omnitrophica bacterium]|nr:phosphatidylglycerophosphatase A [Candidatus Omnitrophota bacterium]